MNISVQSVGILLIEGRIWKWFLWIIFSRLKRTLNMSSLMMLTLYTIKFACQWI